MIRYWRSGFGLAFALAVGALIPVRGSERIPIKVMVLAGFEVGDDTGDAPGEFQFWFEREHLSQKTAVPGMAHPLCSNDQGLYGTVAANTRDPDLTPVRTSELVMALCLDPRFDLRHTYWIVDGIAGIDPAIGSIGSAVWAQNVVDGDALREIDDRQLPAGWPYGLFAIGTKQPNRLPGVNGQDGGWGGATLAYRMVFPLNPGLARWARKRSQHVPLVDSPALAAWRQRYAGYPLAQQPPQVILGDALGSVRYWHGSERTQWARDWVKLWTDGKGTFGTTSMEAQDYVGTLTRMAAMGYLDLGRVLVLRTGSNYCVPPPGEPVTATIGDESLGTDAALEAGYRAGSAVAHELLTHWSQYDATIPSD
jgi:purine nucleoside permease